MPWKGGLGDSGGGFSLILSRGPLEGGSRFSPCPEESAASPSAAERKTPATSGSESPEGSGRRDADLQSVVWRGESEADLPPVSCLSVYTFVFYIYSKFVNIMRIAAFFVRASREIKKF